VHDEFQYDKFHQEADKIYRVSTLSTFNGNENHYSRTPLPLAERIITLPSIQAAARVFERGVTVSIPETDIRHNEPRVWFADSTLVDILTFYTLHGDLRKALDQPTSLVITENAAMKYFNQTDVVGKTVVFENRLPMNIAAVVANYPEQSTLQFEFIAPFDRYLELENPENVEYLKTDWIYSSVQTFIKTHSIQITSAINNELMTLNASIPDERVSKHIQYKAQRITDMHLYSRFRGEQSNPRIINLFVLVAIGMTLFIIAVSNYISLTSAEWISRAKELSIRKLMGSTAPQITLQFMLETLLFSVTTLPLTILLVFLGLPYFNEVVQKQLSMASLLSWPVLALLGIAIASYTLITGLLQIRLIKTKFRGQQVKPSSTRLPASLVMQGVLTFTIACLSVIGFRQLSYINKKDLGYQKENIITVPLFSDNFNSIIGQVTGDLRGRMNYFESEALKNPAVEAISCSAFRLGSGAISALTKTDSLGEEDNIFLALNSVDYDFLETVDVSLLAGRSFSRDYGTDHELAFILNEEAVRVLGFKNPVNAIGKTVEAVGKKGQVVGVVPNFHFEGLQNQIRPLIFEVAAWKFSNFTIRLSGHDNTKAIDFLRTTWNEVFPETVFQYEYLDNDLANNYRFEASLASLTKGISILTILLSLLGIYSSASHLAIRRVKEIAMRKVLGATNLQLLHSFSMPFIRVLAFAFLLSLPIIYYCGYSWLSTFAYHISISTLDLVIVLFSGSLLVFLSLGKQLWKVVRLNPVKNIRHE
jgi:putative ABC transport system permease protein